MFRLLFLQHQKSKTIVSGAKSAKFLFRVLIQGKDMYVCFQKVFDSFLTITSLFSHDDDDNNLKQTTTNP